MKPSCLPGTRQGTGVSFLAGLSTQWFWRSGAILLHVGYWHVSQTLLETVRMSQNSVWPHESCHAREPFHPIRLVHHAIVPMAYILFHTHFRSNTLIAYNALFTSLFHNLISTEPC